MIHIINQYKPKFINTILFFQFRMKENHVWIIPNVLSEAHVTIVVPTVTVAERALLEMDVMESMVVITVMNVQFHCQKDFKNRIQLV